MLGESIFKIREKNNLSQESFAESLGVARNTIQNWESGKSVPDATHLQMISRKYGVSLDEIVCGNNRRTIEERFEKISPTKFTPSSYEANILVEYEQSMMEGKNIGEYRNLFCEVSKMPLSEYKIKLADTLFEIVMSARQTEDYPYMEPSTYDEICRLCDGYSFQQAELSEDQLEDKIKGAWYGRICGCLLGKPIEGINEKELDILLKETGNYPLQRYIKYADFTDEIISKLQYPVTQKPAWIDTIGDMAPADDDTNYTVLASILIEKYGKDFRPENVLELWATLQPENAYYTAEHVAYKNYLNGYLPPYSAVYKNPCREYIGAQIRGDYFGYINPGNPKMAAKMAYKDACASHIKNGIYGEMFIAAMIAAGLVCDDMEQVIRAGLSQIPSTSRLYEDITDVVRFYHTGKNQKDCWNLMREKYPADHPCSWTYTNSNAMIVVMSLLYNDLDYEKSICTAVQAVYDTDCNGATVGSIIGAMKGYQHIPEKWTEPIHNKLCTSIVGMETVSIDALVEKTLKAIVE